jgi:putative transcriptional regulator
LPDEPEDPGASGESTGSGESGEPGEPDGLAPPPGSTAGRLLVASPALGDPNFERTVVLMLEHTGDGAVGLVLNRPSALELSGALPEWDGYAASPAVVFVGGPVSQGSVIALARARGDTEGSETDAWTPIARLDGLGVIDLGKDPYEHGVAVEEVRVFTGYAGWGGGQLESELREGAWFVVDAVTDDALATDPESLWPAVLRRQGGALARLALYPPDPSVN